MEEEQDDEQELPTQLVLEETKEAILEDSAIGFQPYRLASNWREQLIVKFWKEKCRLYGSNLPRALLDEGLIGVSEAQEQLMVKSFSTAIQWLATNVGYGFLREAMEVIGVEMRELPDEECLLSDRQHTRELALQRIKTRERCDDHSYNTLQSSASTKKENVK